MNINKKGVSSLAVAIVLAVMVASLTIIVMQKTRTKPGTVVIVMGTSSSGKTSIINELKKTSDTYEIVNIDTFAVAYEASHTLPEPRELETLDEKTKKQVIEKYQQAFVNEFYALARDKALQGHTVMVDTVPLLEKDKAYEHISRILKDVNTIKVLLYCPLDITQAHVEQRNLTGMPEEHREPIVTTIPQYKMLYKPQESASETVVDTISGKDTKQLVRSAINSFMKNLPDELKDKVDKVTQDLEGIYKEFVQHFKLDELEEIAIVPQKPYDLILDCKHTPEDLAKTIVEFLKTKEYKHHETISAWQTSIERTLAAKKSGQFETTDKAGAPVIIEWFKAVGLTPEYAKAMQQVWEITRDAYVPVEKNFLETYPAQVADYFDGFKKAIPGIEAKLDATANLDEKIELALRKIAVIDASSPLAHMMAAQLNFFVSVKDANTQDLLGYITFLIMPNDKRGDIKATYLAVAPAAQGRGLATVLMSSILKILPSVNRIYLSTRVTNDVAQRAYKKIGFTKDSHPVLWEGENPAHWIYFEYATHKSDILQKAASALIER